MRFSWQKILVSLIIRTYFQSTYRYHMRFVSADSDVTIGYMKEVPTNGCEDPKSRAQ